MPLEPRATCEHDRAAIVDSRFFGHIYSTEASRRIFCDQCRMQRWLDIEAALALTQADLGLIPYAHAERIAETAHLAHLDLDMVREAIRHTGHSLVGLIQAHQQAAGDDAGEFVHYGATTQDIQDTGQALEMREVLDELTRELEALIQLSLKTAETHAHTVMAGRTHARTAAPITYGLKVAGWLDELVRDAERIEQLRDRVLVVQLFGAVGTMAGYGQNAAALLEGFAARLGLQAPTLGWHVARDRVAEYVNALAILAGTLARIANEVRTLSRPELGELELPWRYGQVGSSTMPHKRNPDAAQQVVVLAHLAAAQAQLGLQALLGEHERDSRALRLEWPAVADVSHYTLASISISRRVLAGITVKANAMARNVLSETDALCTEALMLALAPHLGKQSAHALVYEISQRSTDGDRSLYDVVRADGSPIRGHLSVEEIAEIFAPARYLGQSQQLVGASIDHAASWLTGRAPAETVAA